VGCAHGLREVYRVGVVGRLWGREGGVVIVYHLITFVWDVDQGGGNVEGESRGVRLWQDTEHSRRGGCAGSKTDQMSVTRSALKGREKDGFTNRPRGVISYIIRRLLKKYNIIIQIITKNANPLPSSRRHILCNPSTQSETNLQPSRTELIFPFLYLVTSRSQTVISFHP